MNRDLNTVMKESWRSARLGGVLIVLLTLVAYFPAMRGGFIWDDDDHLTGNPAMLSVGGLKRIWSSLAVSRYYPLTLTSFWVQRHFWGLHPLPYHVVNIALHAVNAVLLWALLGRLKVRGAWIAAALWALHPVCVESVAWVTELKNTQSGLFFLLALLTFLRFEHGLRPRDYVIAMVCGVAAMLSKPSTVVLPGVMLLCAWWQRNRWKRSDFLRVAPLMVFAVGISLLTIVEQHHHIERDPAFERTMTAAQRLVQAGYAVWFYAGKLLWPTDLCFIYPRWELRAHSAVAWVPLVGLALVAGALWYFRRAGWARATTFGLGYFILALLPVLGFFDIYFFQFSFVADHFQYLASMGLIALAVSTGTTVCSRAGQWGRYLGMFIAAAVLIMLGVSTWRQAHVYQDIETLWRDTLTKNPDAWMAQYNLGNALLQQGKVSEAIAKYAAALRIKPDYVEAHNNLGTVLASQGKVSEAMAQFVAALHIDPDYAEAHNNLGTIFVDQGKVSEAITEYTAALRIKPDSEKAHYNLGNALLQQGKISEAIRQYEQVLRITPDDAEAHYSLGDALLELGKVSEAIAQYRELLRSKPDFPTALYKLAWILATDGNANLRNAGEAVQLAERLCAITGYQQAAALDALAAAYAEDGRFDDAIRVAQKAIELENAAGQQELAQRIQERLKLYRAGQPFHEGSASIAPAE
jgi:tetratricopeptide (TPR) repeat protein